MTVGIVGKNNYISFLLFIFIKKFLNCLGGWYLENSADGVWLRNAKVSSTKQKQKVEVQYKSQGTKTIDLFVLSASIADDLALTADPGRSATTVYGPIALLHRSKVSSRPITNYRLGDMLWVCSKNIKTDGYFSSFFLQ